MLGPWVTIGFTESVLFTRQNGFPDFQYINPFSIYFVTNTNQEAGSGNLMHALQWRIHPFVKTVAFKGQISIDDFQFDNETGQDQEPNHWGCDMRLSWSALPVVPLPHVVQLEYRYASRWLYSVADAGGNRGERYTFHGQSLGNSFTDGDEVRCSFQIAGQSWWMGTAGFSFRRNGPNTPQTRWSTSDTYNSAFGTMGYRTETPFSQRDSITTTADFFLRLSGYIHEYADVTAYLHNRWIQEDSHPDYMYKPLLGLRLRVHFSDLVFRLPVGPSDN